MVNQVTDSLVKTESVKPAAHAALSIATSILSDIAGAFVVIGIPLIAAAWFAGPSRYATRAREFIAPFLRERPEWTYAIVAAIMLLDLHLEPDRVDRQTRRHHRVLGAGVLRRLPLTAPDG